jgi:hypothetical protein
MAATDSAPATDSMMQHPGRPLKPSRLNAYPKRGLTLWRRVDFVVFSASPERVRSLFG